MTDRAEVEVHRLQTPDANWYGRWWNAAHLRAWTPRPRGADHTGAVETGVGRGPNRFAPVARSAACRRSPDPLRWLQKLVSAEHRWLLEPPVVSNRGMDDLLTDRSVSSADICSTRSGTASAARGKATRSRRYDASFGAIRTRYSSVEASLPRHWSNAAPQGGRSYGLTQARI